MTDLTRLLSPKSVAVIGGGAWCETVLNNLRSFPFQGTIYAIHPSKPSVAGVKTWQGAHLLPDPPDATFIGINREASIGAVERLRKRGAGGAICYASGFSGPTREDATGADAQTRLIRAAQDMPILGPNCFGFINALEGVAIWPMVHALTRVEKGVAVLTKSNDITLPNGDIAFLGSCGDETQLTMADIATALLRDDRITELHLHAPESDITAQIEKAAHIPVEIIPG